MTQLPLREALPVEETWDLSLLFKDSQAYHESISETQELILSFEERFKGHLNDVETIINSLEDYEMISRRQAYISAYGSLGYETDKLNREYEENRAKLEGFAEYSSAHLVFYISELSGQPVEILEAVMTHPNGEPFKYFLQDIIDKQPYLLSPEAEAVLSRLSATLQHPYIQYLTTKFQDLTFDSFEANGKTYQNSFVTFEGDFEAHLDANIRRESWKSFHEGLAHYQHTAAENYINHVKTEKRLASLRGFDSVIDYLLMNQKVSREAYNRQIDVIMAEFAPVMRRYAKLLKEEQQLDSIGLCDIKMPFTTIEPEKISISASRELMENIFGIFGEEYLSVVQRSFDERWIDFPMNQTKSTGGFCLSVYDGPSYTLLNWTGLLSEVLVLAHELGHAGHFNLSNKRQLSITPEASLYFIEAPSTANEVIACQYLLNQPIDDAQKRVLISEFISRTYFHNMVTHLLEADFQRKVYQAVDNGELLNATVLNQFFHETLSQFWGEAVEITPGAELTWMRQPHYFMGLYPYTYSAGLTVGTQIGQRIAKGEQAAIDSWLTVLKAGGTLSPLELAAKAGVSMENANALRSAIQYVDGLLDQIEALKA
ncbi:oligoendopeptidase F [Tuanshanicoccus lijuaniae]|uniref:oligoendopeptidase F n=1 Tax=Aerococcaceae bacterium zg-1292 TaxID=2774330 RepID=UPI001937744E|nr:oligoendopeptidase F [Aerococcaceae bacterium zg-1292]QQA36811.1 oligoendopeptidase F [Aerococcaceae bacterium zg-1292]